MLVAAQQVLQLQAAVQPAGGGGEEGGGGQKRERRARRDMDGVGWETPRRGDVRGGLVSVPGPGELAVRRQLDPDSEVLLLSEGVGGKKRHAGGQGTSRKRSEYCSTAGGLWGQCRPHKQLCGKIYCDCCSGWYLLKLND